MTKIEKVIGGIAVFAVILALVGLVGGNQPVSKVIERVIERPLSGVSDFDELALQDAGVEDAVIDYHQFVLGSGVTSDVWTNRTGTDVFVDYGSLITSGTASTSYRVFMFATTSTSVASTNDFTLISAALNTDIIRAWPLATSTTATTTDTVYAINDGINDGMPTRIRNGQSVIVYLQSTFFGPCSGSVCETATSTNRGFNVTGFIRTHATSSPSNQ